MPTDGRDLLRRVGALPGFGKQKAQIFVALLGKQYGVEVPGWREAAGDFGPEGTYKSVADIRDADSLARVRDYKKQLKAAAEGGRLNQRGPRRSQGRVKDGTGRRGPVRAGG